MFDFLFLVMELGSFLLILLSVAFFTLFERKILGSMHLRLGPNKIGVYGLIQPFADALKLLSKSEKNPNQTMSYLYFISPMISFLMSTLIWTIAPVKWGGWTNSSMSLIYSFLFYSLSVYGVFMSGWFSNSKFASLGVVRGICQSISYEIGLAFSFITVCVIFSTLSFNTILELRSELFLLFPLLGVCLPLSWILLSETARPPFDLPEGESELVGGFQVEYGGMSYTLIFLSENLAILWSVWVLSWIFLGGSFVMLLLYSVIWIRASLPRFRFDKVMSFFWLTILPFLLGVTSLYFSLC